MVLSVETVTFRLYQVAYDSTLTQVEFAQVIPLVLRDYTRM